jgi:hypothetical protein
MRLVKHLLPEVEPRLLRVWPTNDSGVSEVITLYADGS